MTIQNQPNILVIFSDQLRRDALGCYGNPDIETPNIDALAKDGVRFNNACATFPICVPFRFTLMTGMYAHSRFVPAIEYRMSPAETTLADRYNAAGYHTMYVGKWHLYGGHAHLPNHPARKANLTPVPREHQGRWQTWRGFDVANNPFDTYYFKDDDPTPQHIEGFQTDGLFDITMETLRARDPDKPFACVLSVEPPHFPLEAPEKNLEKWQNRDVTLPPNYRFQDKAHGNGRKADMDSDDTLIEQRKTYYAMIENLDENVGRLRQFLHDEGLADNTILVVISDHGQMDGAHNLRATRKSEPYEESIGIPFIVFDPRLADRAGVTLTPPTCTEDLFPTLLGLVDIREKMNLPGLDLTSLLRGEKDVLPREGVLLEFVHDLRTKSHFYHDRYWRGFRTERYKYTVLGDASEGGTPWQFFDLDNDPYEMNNLIDTPDAHDEIIRMHQLLRQRMIETGDHYVLAEAWGIAGLNLWAD